MNLQEVKEAIKPYGWTVFTFPKSNVFHRIVGKCWVGLREGYTEIEADSPEELIKAIKSKHPSEITLEEEKQLWEVGGI